MNETISTSALPLDALSAPGEADDAGRPTSIITLTRSQRMVFLLTVAAIGIAVAAPYPATKLVLGATLALYWAMLLANFDERFTGMFVLFLPTFVLLPEQIFGVPGLNWQTIFMGIFLVAAVSAPAPVAQVGISRWLTYFSVVLVMAATHSWVTGSQQFWPLLLAVKHWLFPFVLFFLGWRCFRTEQQLWFLVLAVAVASLALALHGLRDGLTTGNLLTNRPGGLLTGQANLFAGYLAMHALIFLFVSRSRDIGRVPRLCLTGTATVMLAALLFTLSRGAWLAFFDGSHGGTYAEPRPRGCARAGPYGRLPVGSRGSSHARRQHACRGRNVWRQQPGGIARRFRSAAGRSVEGTALNVARQSDLGLRTEYLSAAACG
jgi:hypothetical protein